MTHKPTGEKQILFEIKGLSAGYDRQQPVLHDVDLTVCQGDFLGIIGPNGGGKTTLIRCILGLLQPWQGSVKFAGEARPSIGYLPQYSSIDRRFPITVEEVVLSGLSARTGLMRRPGADERRLAAQTIAQMGLEGMEHRPIGSLSGGQLQRALLGRAVVSSPPLLILDEPNTYLDLPSETQLYRLLEELNARCAIILVSHDVGTVLQQVRSIACVNRTLDYHPEAEGVTGEWLERNFRCPIDLLGHGALPHRVLAEHHKHEEKEG